MANEKQKEGTILFVTFPDADKKIANSIAKKMLMNLEYEHLHHMKTSNIQVCTETEFHKEVLFPMMLDFMQSDEFIDFVRECEKRDEEE